MFVDEAEILVRGGDGGGGCVSFRREKYVPRGGPNGGNGGDGGSVLLLASEHLATLADFTHRNEIRAARGERGEGKNRTGRSGGDEEVPVPVGTVVRDVATGEILADLALPGARYIVARGGKGGRGNAAFKSAVHQAPREHEAGKPGEERRLKLELKLVADVGLVGLPNAGKSTLLSRISRARPKVADYPFTTLAPVLGVVELDDGRQIVVADLPGLIEGAHEGAGLGDRFLRHVERTKFLVHLVDVGDETAGDPAANYRTIRREVESWSPELAARPERVVATKLDIPGGAERADTLTAAIGKPVDRISSVTGEGLGRAIATWIEALAAS